MVSDTSALVAILLGEVDRPVFTQLIAADAVRLLSAANAIETSIVVESRKGEAGRTDLSSVVRND